MGTRALAVLLLTPSVALAQFGAVSPAEIPRTDVDWKSTKGCTDTSNSVQITFTINATGAAYNYAAYAQSSSCPTGQTPSATPVTTSSLVDTTLRTLTVSPDALRQAVGISSCNSPADVTYYVCVYLMNGSSIVATAFSDGTSKFQLAIPPAPVITGVEPANGALGISVAQGTPTSNEQASSNITFQAVASATGQPTVTAPGTPTGNTSFRVSGLANNVQYTVTAYAFSSAGNPSAASVPFSDPKLTTPLPFKSFWESYQGAGGREQGGCGGGAGELSLLALVPLALRRRRP